MDVIDAAWASHDAMRAAVWDFRDAATDYLDGSAVPDLPAEYRLLGLARAAAAHLAVPFEAAADQDAAHNEYEQLKAENVRLRIIAEAAASACREREITPYLIDVLDAAGYETAPRVPDPDQAELDRYWAARDHER